MTSLEYGENIKVNEWIDAMIAQNKTGFMREILTGYEAKKIRESGSDPTEAHDFDYGSRLSVQKIGKVDMYTFMSKLIIPNNDTNYNSFDYILIRLENERIEEEEKKKKGPAAAPATGSETEQPQPPSLLSRIFGTTPIADTLPWKINTVLYKTYEQHSTNLAVYETGTTVSDHVKELIVASPFKTTYSIADDRDVMEVTLDEVKRYLSKVDFFSLVDRRSVVPLILDGDIDMKKILSYIQT